MNIKNGEYMEDTLEKTMMYLFFMKNEDTDIYGLNKSAIIYFYSLPSAIREKMDVSYFWGLVVKEWHSKQKKVNKNKQLETIS